MGADESLSTFINRDCVVALEIGQRRKVGTDKRRWRKLHAAGGKEDASALSMRLNALDGIDDTDQRLPIPFLTHPKRESILSRDEVVIEHRAGCARMFALRDLVFLADSGTDRQTWQKGKWEKTI